MAPKPDADFEVTPGERLLLQALVGPRIGGEPARDGRPMEEPPLSVLCSVGSPAPLPCPSPAAEVLQQLMASGNTHLVNILQVRPPPAARAAPPPRAAWGEGGGGRLGV